MDYAYFTPYAFRYVRAFVHVRIFRLRFSHVTDKSWKYLNNVHVRNKSCVFIQINSSCIVFDRKYRMKIVNVVAETTTKSRKTKQHSVSCEENRAE